jgi:hypothetical protein
MPQYGGQRSVGNSALVERAIRLALTPNSRPATEFIAARGSPEIYRLINSGRLICALVQKGSSASVTRGFEMTFFKMSFAACQNCGKRARLIRRGVRFDEGGYFEQQEFVCSRCNMRMHRKVNTDGTIRDENPSHSKVAHESLP